MNTLPTIHMNGTGPQMLFDDYLAAHHALDSALDVCFKIEFNARDYYPQGDNPQGDNAWANARDEMASHLRAIRTASDAFRAVAEHVQKTRKRRKR